jgi:hypothetical protein
LHRTPSGVDLDQGDSFDTSVPVNLCHGVIEEEGNVKIVKALNHVAHEAARVGKDLGYGLDPGSFQGEAACHDQADVA